MSTNCNFTSKVKKSLDKFFEKSVINKIGKQSGFIKRKARKIKASHFVIGFLVSCSKGLNSYTGWATQIGLLTGKAVSKQAIFDRITESSVTFCSQLVEKFLLESSRKNFSSDLFSYFKSVLLQDSTTLRLPTSLAEIFPGSRNQHGNNAIARIQSVINVKAMKFVRFTLGHFRQNDQSASDSILQLVKKGDLAIRDLGYFSLAVFEQLINAEVYFLSRLRFGVKIYDEHKKEIPLKALLKSKRTIDRWVYIGANASMRVRLVMIAVPAQQREQKIRRAKKDKDPKANHSREYYQWLGYSVYITTVEKEVWSSKQVAQAYAVRWQIEIIFKSWKSGFRLQAMLHEGCTNANRVKVCIYLMLLFICLFMQKIYVRYKDEIERKTAKQVSLLKLSQFISHNLLEIFTQSHRVLKESIALHCCYDKRYDRTIITDLFKK